MVCKCFDKKSTLLKEKSATGSGIKNKIRQNEQLAEELHEPIITKFEKQKVNLSFKDNNWAADHTDMLLISKFNKSIRFSLCDIDIFTKYAWVVPLKDKKGTTITNPFQI